MSNPEGEAQSFRRFVPENDTHVAVALSNQILRSTVGSRLYGTELVHETLKSDQDEMGVFIEPPDYVFGFRKCDSFQQRTAGDGEKSSPDDLDRTMYSLRHYISLAIQGNPSILNLLFAPDEFILHRTDAGKQLQKLAPFIVSKRAYPRFRGYLQSQKQRLQGVRRGHVPSRPHLIEQFGYDTKYAMHALRLGLQGCELMRTGRLELPMVASGWLKEVRNGLLTYEEAIENIEVIEKNLEEDFERSSLRENPDFEKLAKWVKTAHIRHWAYLSEIGEL